MRAVYAANPRTVVVLVHGGSVTIEWTKAHVPAILDAHYPGEMGGDAIAGALYGDYSPAGRLTQTVYPEAFNKQRALSDMGLRTLGGVTYKYYTAGEPQWPFGFGLSYTTFRFRVATPDAACTTKQLAQHYKEYYAPGAARPKGPAGWAVEVTNTGRRAGGVVVLGFVGSTRASRADAPPRKELFAFDRVPVLAPGAARTVTLTAAGPVLALVDASGTEYVAPGDYDVEFGVRGSAEDAAGGGKGVVAAALHVSGARVDLFSLPAARAAADHDDAGPGAPY